MYRQSGGSGRITFKPISDPELFYVIYFFLSFAGVFAIASAAVFVCEWKKKCGVETDGNIGGKRTSFSLFIIAVACMLIAGICALIARYVFDWYPRGKDSNDFQ